MNLIVPGWLHLYFREYIRFTLVIGITIVSIIFILTDGYSIMIQLLDQIKTEQPLSIERLFIFRIIFFFILMNAVYYASLRYLIKKIESSDPTGSSK